MVPALDILLVEDSEALAGNIGEYLERLGHRVDFAYDGEDGLRMALEKRFDVVILDVALPRIDGLRVCRLLRERAERHVPVIILTARDTLHDKLQGFAEGADDYLTKPFALPELAARCDALSNRHLVGRRHLLEIGPLTIDRQARKVRRGGQDFRLGPVGWNILLVLAEEWPGAVSRAELTRRLWGEDPPDSDSLRSHMHLLRQVVDKPFEWPMIETVHGHGFRLRDRP
jgi:DNA-binding response OmpR family regulator